MYLSLLNKEEKEVFLGMAYHLASVDGNYSEEEKAMIDGYCQELQCTFDEETMIKPIGELRKRIKNSSEKTKKIFIFELVGLAMADGKYDNDEKEIIGQMIMEYGLNSDFASKCESLLNEYIEFQSRINNLVLE